MTATALQACTAQLELRLGPGRVTLDAPLAPLTTFKVGGTADLLVEARTEDELAAVVRTARETGLSVTALGGGSNVLVGDGGVRGVVVLVRDRTIGREDATGVRAGAGLTINGLVRWLVGQGLACLEAWAGTPGTVGGALHGNAHFKGVNIGDLVREVRVLDRQIVQAETLLHGAQQFFVRLVQSDPDEAAVGLRRAGVFQIEFGAPPPRLVGDAIDHRHACLIVQTSTNLAGSSVKAPENACTRMPTQARSSRAPAPAAPCAAHPTQPPPEDVRLI